MDASANTITFEYHKELNPNIWTDNKLNPEIREKLLEIAAAFVDYLDLDVDIEDITLTGSLANYNYTKYSDFDLHILTDYKQYDVDKDLLKDTYLIENGWTVIRINWFNPVIESNKLKLYSQIENFKNIIKL